MARTQDNGFLVDDQVRYLIDKISELYTSGVSLSTARKHMQSQSQSAARIFLSVLEIPKDSSLWTSVIDDTIVLGQVITWSYYYVTTSKDVSTRKTLTEKADSVQRVAQSLRGHIQKVASVTKRKIIVFSVLMACALVMGLIACILLALACISGVLKHVRKGKGQGTQGAGKSALGQWSEARGQWSSELT